MAENNDYEDDRPYRNYWGGFGITPDLPRSSVDFPTGGYLRGAFTDREVGVEIDGAPDIATVSRLSGIRPPFEHNTEEGEIHGLDDQLRGIVAQIPEGHTVDGALYSEGMGEFDLERFRVEGRDVVRERPRWVWPDGSAVGRYEDEG